MALLAKVEYVTPQHSVMHANFISLIIVTSLVERDKAESLDFFFIRIKVPIPDLF